MKEHTSSPWLLVVWLPALFILGCDAGDSSLDDAAGGGGSPSSGGATSTGGAPSAGSGSGGSPSSAGTSGAGGSPTSSGGGGGTGGSGTLPPAPACAMAGAWQSADKWASQTLDAYFIRNNLWNHDKPGAGTQTLWAASSRCWGVTASHTDVDPKGTVKSYPDIARGWVIGTPGFTNPNHGLAIQVSALTKAKIRWKMQAPTDGRTWALWDIYFHDSANPGGNTAPVNLMIQQRIVDSDGWMQEDSSSWSKVTIDGHTFREKLETTSVSSTRSRIVLYVDQASGHVLGTDDFLLDLKAVIDHYVQSGNILASDYLTSIQAGWEIVSGGTYQTDDFWTAVQNDPEP